MVIIADANERVIGEDCGMEEGVQGGAGHIKAKEQCSASACHIKAKEQYSAGHRQTEKCGIVLWLT